MKIAVQQTSWQGRCRSLQQPVPWHTFDMGQMHKKRGAPGALCASSVAVAAARQAARRPLMFYKSKLAASLTLQVPSHRPRAS